MNKNEIRKCIKKWLPTLELEHWRIKYEIGTDEENNEAECEIVGPYRTASIKFNENYTSWTPKYGEEVVVHELLHLHLHGLRYAAKSSADVMEDEAALFYLKRIEWEVEAVVEALAQALIKTNEKHTKKTLAVPVKLDNT